MVVRCGTDYKHKHEVAHAIVFKTKLCACVWWARGGQCGWRGGGCWGWVGEVYERMSGGDRWGGGGWGGGWGGGKFTMPLRHAHPSQPLVLHRRWYYVLQDGTTH